MKPQARTENILIQPIDAEVILYDEKSQKAHQLNQTAAFVWQHCDGTRTVAELASLLHREMDLPEDQQLVQLALDQLQKQNLLKTSTGIDVTRREAVKRLRGLGIAMAVIPAVFTIAAPPPAAAASGTPAATTTAALTTGTPWSTQGTA